MVRELIHREFGVRGERDCGRSTAAAPIAALETPPTLAGVAASTKAGRP